MYCTEDYCHEQINIFTVRRQFPASAALTSAKRSITNWVQNHERFWDCSFIYFL